jgi:hypothetical protein
VAILGQSEELGLRLRSAPVLRRHGSAIVLLLCVAAFYLATIRQGNTWGDDYALYIRHAQNIAASKPYADTGYIYNPAVPIYGPPTYPPVFPLLLVPLYHFAGLNFWAMKCEQVVLFVLTLLVIYLQLLRYTSPGNASIVIAVLGFNPNFWAAKDNILSDLPFLFFFWLAVWLTCRPLRNCRGAVLLGSVLYLAAGTRIIGITIVAGFLLHEFLTRRKLTMFALLPAAISLVLLAAQSRIMAFGQGSSLDLFHPTVSGVIGNSISYTRALATFWMENAKSALAFLVLAVTTVLATAGIYAHAKRRWGVLEVSLVLYLAAVIIWPGRPGIRLIYPVIPFYVYLVVAGGSFLTSYFAKANLRVIAAAGLLFLLGTGYLVVYRQGNWRIIAETDGLASFNDLCHRVQISTRDDDVFLCRRPRALTLFAHRPASVYAVGSDTDWWRFAEKIHASYLLCNRQETQDAEFLRPFVTRSKSNLELIYQNVDFDLYRIRSYETPPLNRDPQAVMNPIESAPNQPGPPN